MLESRAPTKSDVAYLAGLSLVVFCWTLIPIQGFDIWFYLEVGRQVVEDFHIPWSESFLGTTEVYAFGRHANQAWLSSVVCFLFYKFGGLSGLVALRSLLMAAIASVSYLNCRLYRLPQAWSFGLVLLGVWTVKGRILLRSVLFTDLCLALLMLGLIWHDTRTEDKSFPLKWLLLLFVLWTNTHQGVAAGGLCLFLWLAVTNLPWKTRLVSLILCALATLVRPYGWYFPRFFTEHFGNEKAVQDVLEWAPLDFSTFAFLLGPLILILLLSVATSVNKEGFTWGKLLLPAVFLFMAYRSQRSIGEVLPVVVPIVAYYLALAKPKKVLLAPLALLLPVLFYSGWLGSSDMRLTQLQHKYPDSILEELPAEHGQLFNSYEFGNYLVFKGKKPFIHGITSLFQEQLVKEFNSVLNRGPKRLELMERFQIEEVLLHHPTEVDSTEQLLSDLFEDKDWHLHWWDDSGYLFRKGQGRNLTAVRPWEDKQWDDSGKAQEELDSLISHKPSGLSLYLRGLVELEKQNPSEALDYFDKSLTIQPKNYQAQLSKGAVHFQLKQIKEAELAFKMALKARPNSPVAHFNLALLYLQTQRAKEASQELDRVLELAPEFPRARELSLQIRAALSK